MSFWPRLRKRSKGRRKLWSSSAAAKANNNPYSSRDVENYRVVRKELQSQRAEFASERGVSVELVRFLSRSSRGWVYLPSETPSPSATPSPSQDGEVNISFSNPPDPSQEFFLPPPALPLAPETAVADSEDGAESNTEGNAVMGVDVTGDSKEGSRLVISRKLKDEAWMRISKTAAVLYVKVAVFSRAFAFTFAVVVNVWSRGKGTLRRVFSAIATQLLATLKQNSSTAALLRAPPKSVPQASAAQESSTVSEMKVSPMVGNSAQDLRSTSFAFPVVSQDLMPNSPHFAVQQKAVVSPQLGSPVEEVASMPAPLVESNKLPSVKHCKLKSKLFKGSHDRKGENSSPSSEFSQQSDTTSSASSTANSSAGGKRSKKKAALSILRKSRDKDELDEVEQPSSSLKPPKKVTRSHELLFFRSPNHHKRKESAAAKEIANMSAIPSRSVEKLSRSLDCSPMSLEKKNVSRSQEFIRSAPPYPVESLTLPNSTVEKLETLAFPFKVERKSSLPSSPREYAPSKRGNSGSKVIAVELSVDKSKSRSTGSRSSSPIRSGKRAKSPTSSSSSAMLAAAELKPKLRKVKTAVGPSTERQGPELLRKAKRSPQSPTQSGEFGRSPGVSRETAASILLLSVLGFLLLGRIPAILCTACLFLVLSHLQRFFLKRRTHQDVEQPPRTTGISRLHNSTSAPPELSEGNSSNHGSPAYGKSDLQSSEYRKRVLIEGLLDRGNRRGGHS